MHIVPFEYDEKLPFYYNNNQRFLQKRLDPKIIQSTKIFEKAEIRWVCVDELKSMRSQFRFYFRELVDKLLEQRDAIHQFISRAHSQQPHRPTSRFTRRAKRRHSRRKSHHHFRH